MINDMWAGRKFADDRKALSS